VLDFAHALADTYDGQCNPIAMYPSYDSGDHLHPNAAGQTAMANAVDTRLFDLRQAPQLPPLVAVTPTPGCRG
jgi:lysophospholipase L1-like esterase